MGDAYCRTTNPLSQILHNPPMPPRTCPSLSELAFRAGGFCIGAFRWAIRLALLCGYANARGAVCRNAICGAGSEYRGAVCSKAIRSEVFLNVEELPAARSFAVRES